jgi:hypothetical protein
MFTDKALTESPVTHDAVSEHRGRGLNCADDAWNFVKTNIERGINEVKKLEGPLNKLSNEITHTVN